MTPNGARPTLDQTVVVAARAGDRLAFDQLVRFYENRIYNYLYRFTQQSQDSEDLTQEVFLKVYQHFHAYDPNKKFSTWLYTIATHTVYDWLRKKRRRPEELTIDDPTRFVETTDRKNPYKVIEARLDIEDGLKHVRPAYRSVLLLFYQNGLSYEEIAAIEGLPLNTVKTYLHRAKQKLRDILEGTYHDRSD